MARKKTTKTTPEAQTSPDLAPDPNWEKFHNIMESLSPEEQIAIFMHRNPDPDSLAAANGLRWLLSKKYGLSSKIFYDGEVSHPQNRTMVNVFTIPLSKSEEYTEEGFTKTIVVDATSKNAPIEKPNIVIDHHRVDHVPGLDHCHIETVGAVSTLIWEYIRASGLPLDDELDEAVVTALFFGIRVDTQELTLEVTTDRDFQASQQLVGYLNRKKLSDVINYPLPPYFFELERVLNTEGNNKTQGSLFVGTVGIISEAKRDCLPMLADKMVRMDGIETTVVFSVIDEKLMSSVRSTNPGFDVNAFCHRVFGKDFSGGKLGIGGASVPLGLASMTDVPSEIQVELWEALKKKMFHKVFHIAGDN